MTSDVLTTLAPASGAWQQAASCRDADPELFFGADDGDRRTALALCAACPVRTDGLEHALTTRENYGVWGGTDEQERKRLLRQRRRAA